MSELEKNITESKIPGESNWPGDWYVFQDGRVDGPYNARDAFSFNSESTDGKSRLVSRKGFSQWYALKDLAEIFNITDKLDREHNTLQEQVNSAIDQQMDEIQSLKKTSSETSTQSFVSKPIVVEKNVAPIVVNAKVKIPAFVEPTQALEKIENNADSVISETAVVGGAAAVEEQIGQSEFEKIPEQTEVKRNVKSAIMHEYFLLKSDIRLGKFRNPWLLGFLTVPLTLGANWIAWYASASREIEFHRSGNNKSNYFAALLAIVPVLHIFMIYKLASSVRRIEEENKYKNTSPLLAAMFAIVPPFAAAYLQDCLNEHWLIHVKYSLKKKQIS